MLRMPTKIQMPEGPHRAFVEELFMYYREAGRPPLRTISDWIRNNADEKNLKGTASTETIRRVLTGITIPRIWPTVDTILEALCGIAGRSPNEDRWENQGYSNGYESPTIRAEVKKVWNAMLDDYEQNEQMPSLPPQRTPSSAQPSSSFDDPWATAPAPVRSVSRSSFDDEPPF
jgi:hypothetical protein